MKQWAGSILKTVEATIANKNYMGLKICRVKSISPLVFTYNGVDLGTVQGDLVYIHPLMVSAPIDLDLEELLNSQDFINSTAYNSPQFQAVIKGSVPDFIKEFYKFYKNWQSIYLLKEGDLIAVYEIAERVYIVLQKVSVDIVEENSEESEDEQ